jgi:hypothetical protein
MAPTGLVDPSSESFYIDMSMEVIQGVPPEEGVTARLPFSGIDLKGMKDGTIICEKFSRQIHSAAITAMATTSDTNWLLTASENGEIFLFRQEERPRHSLDIVELQTVDVPAVTDIKPGDYSIEEEKQKSELDRRIKAADEKKELIKQRIESLRQRYITLVHENAKAPAYKRLSADDFKVDPFLYTLMQEQRDKIIRDASSATKLAAEKSRVALRKVKERLVRLMTDESFCARGIDIKVKMSSF